MKIIKFEQNKIDDIVEELEKAEQKGMDLIHIDNDDFSQSNYFGGINEIKRDGYYGRKLNFAATDVINFNFMDYEKLESGFRLNNYYRHEIIKNNDFVITGYRALLHEKFKQISEKCKNYKNPVKTKYCI